MKKRKKYKLGKINKKIQIPKYSGKDKYNHFSGYKNDSACE